MENLQITEGMRQKLLSAVKWQQFLNIMASIAVGFMALLAILFLFIPQLTSDMPGAFICILYLVIIALYVYPLLKSYKMVSSIRDAMNNDSQMSLEEAVDCYHTILKYCGILAIIGLVIYALIFVAAIVGGVIGAMAMAS